MRNGHPFPNIHGISAVAYDTAPNCTYSAPIDIQVGGPLVVQVAAPANNAVFGASNNNITISGNATRDGVPASITQMRFYRNSVLLGTVTSAPYT